MKKSLRTKIGVFIFIAALLFLMLPGEAFASIGVSARSAILIEQETGRVLYEKDAYTQRRIASITKIMTAILAIESGKMNEKVTVSQNAAGTEGSSLYLKEGEKITLENLVYGLMLRSGNDAAVAIAEEVGGSLEGFVTLMNQKAEEIGMSHTVFMNPHGLDDHENHLSTAYDMAILTQYAMNNDTYRIISSTKVHKAPNASEDWDYVWRNKNKMLNLYPDSTGGKTGYTKRAKRTLVSTAERDGMTLIAVTLDAPDDWDDHISMFNWGFSNYELTLLEPKGTLKAVKKEPYKGNVILSRDLIYPLAKEERDQVKSTIQLVKPPDKEDWDKLGSNEPVGMYFVKLNNETVIKAPIIYESAKKETKGFWKFFKNLFTIDTGRELNG